MKRIYLTSFLFLIVFCSSCKLGRFVVYNFANITDHKIFPKNEVAKGDYTFRFVEGANRPPFDSLTVTEKGEKSRVSFEEYLEQNKTVAFLVIQNDTIKYEKYLNKYEETSIVASFSMAKSILSMLIGVALEDGLIQSTAEPVTNYLPELVKNGFDQLTIEHLLDMSSGIDFNESYANPFGQAASFYYGTNLRKEVAKMKIVHKPGTHFSYSSGDTQVLGLVLAAALKDKSVAQYLSEKIWQPLGMEYAASWSKDRRKNGVEKTFCCVNARARDFAKLGRLYLNEGNWNGQQIIPKEWVQQSVISDEENADDGFYENQWWLKDGDAYAAEGILGQYIHIRPSQNLVIVRLGKNYGKTSAWNKVFQLIGTQLVQKAVKS
ncbi:MAG: serine hydrolase [Bacteroidota bacterium]